MIEEYPRNLLELEAMFSTEEACREYLIRLRWPDGFRCPKCDNAGFWPKIPIVPVEKSPIRGRQPTGLILETEEGRMCLGGETWMRLSNLNSKA